MPSSKLAKKIVLLFASSLTIMSGATIAPSLPQIAEVFSHIKYAEMVTKLVLTVPSLFIAIFSLFVGYIIDKQGRKKWLVFALVLYAVAGTTGLYVDTMWGLLIGRAFLGVAVAGVMTTVITLIGDYLKGYELEKFMGIQGAFISLGGVVFILFGGALANYSWRAPFAIYFASILILPFVLFVLPEPSVVSRVESEADNGKNLHVPKLIILYLIAFFGVLSFFVMPIQIPFLLKEITTVDNFEVGLAIASSVFAGAISSVNYRRISTRFTYRQIYMFAFVLMSAGYFIISSANSYLVVIVGLIVSGLGFGLFIPNTNIFLLSIAPERYRGRAVGGLTTTVFLGQFFSPVVITPLLSHVSQQSVFCYTGFFMLVVLLLIGLSKKLNLVTEQNVGN